MAQRIGEILQARGLIGPQDVEEALKLQVIYGGRLGTILVELERLASGDLGQALSEQLGFPAATNEMLERVDAQSAALLTPEQVEKFEALPLKQDGRKLLVAMTSPQNFPRVEELQFLLGLRLVIHVAPELLTIRWMEKRYGIKPPMRYIRLAPDASGRPAAPPPHRVAPAVLSAPALDDETNEMLAQRAALFGPPIGAAEEAAPGAPARAPSPPVVAPATARFSAAPAAARPQVPPGPPAAPLFVAPVKPPPVLGAPVLTPSGARPAVPPAVSRAPVPARPAVPGVPIAPPAVPSAPRPNVVSAPAIAVPTLSPPRVAPTAPPVAPRVAPASPAPLPNPPAVVPSPSPAARPVAPVPGAAVPAPPVGPSPVAWPPEEPELASAAVTSPSPSVAPPAPRHLVPTAPGDDWGALIDAPPPISSLLQAPSPVAPDAAPWAPPANGGLQGDAPPPQPPEAAATAVPGLLEPVADVPDFTPPPPVDACRAALQAAQTRADVVKAFAEFANAALERGAVMEVRGEDLVPAEVVGASCDPSDPALVVPLMGETSFRRCLEARQCWRGELNEPGDMAFAARLGPTTRSVLIPVMVAGGPVLVVWGVEPIAGATSDAQLAMLAASASEACERFASGGG